MTRWVLAILYAAAIFVASAVPGRMLPAGSLWTFDKVFHFMEYAGLAMLVAWAWGRTWPAVLASGLYGVLDELHQRFTPGRLSSGWDAVADLAGALAGGAVIWMILKRRRVHGDPA